MKMLLYVAGGLVAILALAYLAGSLIPQDHVASVSGDYAAPPEALWAVITDPRRFPEWRTGITKVDIDGDRITEHSRFGPMSYRFAGAQPPRRIETAADEAGARERGFSGSWTFEIAPMPQGSRLVITERGQVFSPFFRLMARFLFGYESTMKQYHADLAKRLLARAGNPR